MSATVLVTGATSGIGAAVARDLARDFAIIATGRNVDALSLLAAETGASTQAVDLTDPAALERFAAELPDELGGIVHSAALGTPGRLEQVDGAEWRRQFELNVIAPAELTRLALPALRRGAGTVVFVNSGAGLRAGPDMPVYAATKHALKGFADSLRAAEAGTIRVATVYPGRVATPMQEGLKRYEGAEYVPGELLQPGTIAAAVRFALTAPRDAQVTDIQIRPSDEAR